MPFSDMRFLAVLLVAIAATIAPATSARTGGDARVERLTALESGVARELNRIRSARDLKRLRTAPGLRTAARAHSRTMLESGFFGHDSPDGTAFSDRIRRSYPSRGWQTWSVGEALLVSETRQIDAPAIVSAWLDSPPHREIALSPVWRDVGIGVYYAASAPGEYGGAEAVVVTADFGLRSGRTTGGQ